MKARIIKKCSDCKGAGRKLVTDPVASCPSCRGLGETAEDIIIENYSQFKTMRHIETVRNYLQACIIELLNRAATHDQSKLKEPELAVFNEYTPKLRNIVYGSEEYRQCVKEMKPAVDHHVKINRHHPEYHEKKILGMNLIDLIEMLCDWKAATLRHNTGNIYKSLEINAERFNYSQELRQILKNTIDWLEQQGVQHEAQES